MTTYVQKKNRFWMERKDIKPERRRSQSRLKSYTSSTDIRNWCDIVEDRRQHILELVVKDLGKDCVKLIPIEAIVSVLLAMVNKDLAQLRCCMKDLWEFINGLQLNQSDLNKLRKMKANMYDICLDLGGREEPKECVEDCVGVENAEAKSPLADTGSDGVNPQIKVTTKGPAKMVFHASKLQPGFTVDQDPNTPGHITIKAAGPPLKKTKGGVDSESEGAMVPRQLKKRQRGLDSNSDIGVVSHDKIAATEALCKEQKDKIEELTKEKDKLQKMLDECLKELDNFKKLQAVANPTLPASCQQEIEALEAEINIMRSGNPSPEEEAQIIKKEVEILKRYCTKLKEVESENQKLKVELGSRVVLTDSDTDSSEPNQIQTLKDKLKNLEDLTNERDMLAAKVKELEQQALQYQNLPYDLDVLKNRSQMLDSTLEERDNLGRKCKHIKSLEDELAKFKKKSERVDELERELRSMSKDDRSSGIELKKTRSIAGSLEKELQNVKSEKDAMQKRIESLRKELDNQKAKATEAEMLRLERDRLQIKLNELAEIQGQYEEMMNKIKIFDNVKAERDMYKQKYEEVLDMECRCEMLKAQVDEARTMSRERDQLQKQVQDLEACICDQEEEIKKLVCQCESIAKTKENTNSKMNALKQELNKKDRVIASSEEQLVQTQSMATRIKELEKLLHNAEHKILKKDCQIACLENQLSCQTGSLSAGKKLNRKELDSIKQMTAQLAAAKAENQRLQDILNRMVSIGGDDQMKKILKQSECAVKRVVEELSQQYKDWEHLKTKNPKGKFATTNKRDCLCRSTSGEEVSSGDDWEKLRSELEGLQREKVKLELTVKQMQNQDGEAGLKCRCTGSYL